MLDNLSAGWNALEFEASGDNKLLFQLHMPEKCEEGRKYPLIIYMHGAGSKSDENRHIYSPFSHFLRALETDRYKNDMILLAPCCPKAGGWVQKREKTATSLDSNVEPTKQMQAVIELLDAVSSELPIDPERLYLYGNSMGSHATWQLLARFPRRFAAAVPVCGAGDPDAAEKFDGTAIWIFHGNADATVPYESSVRMHNALRELGRADVRFTTFDGAGHNITKQVADTEGLFEWLFAQKRSADQWA